MSFLQSVVSSIFGNSQPQLAAAFNSAPPPPPPAPPAPPSIASTSVQAAGAAVRAAAAAAGGTVPGFGNTVSTGAGGAPAPATTGGKSTLSGTV